MSIKLGNENSLDEKWNNYRSWIQTHSQINDDDVIAIKMGYISGCSAILALLQRGKPQHDLEDELDELIGKPVRPRD